MERVVAREDDTTPPSWSIMSCIWGSESGGGGAAISIGYAIAFDWDPSKVYVGAFRENPSTTNYASFRVLKEAVRPSLIIVPQKCKVPASVLTTQPAITSSSTVPTTKPVPIKYVSILDFSKELAIEKIRSLSPGGGGTMEQVLMHVNLKDNPLKVSALGALLSHLQRSSLRMSSEITFLPHSLDTIVSYDTDTLHELQIFKEDIHPAGHHGIGKAKEGLSVFGIVSCRAKTSNGRALLQQWFLHPTNDVSVLQQRHDAISYLLSSSCDADNSVKPMLKALQCPITSFRKIQSGNHLPTDWIKVFKSARILEVLLTKVVAEFVTPSPPELLQYHHVEHTLHVLHRFVTVTTQVLDLEQSLALNTYVIQYGCNAELDQARTLVQTIPSFLTAVGGKELEKLPIELRSRLVLHVVYFPQFGYHIGIPTQHGGEDDAMRATFAALQWEYVFSANDHSFYKNDAMKELDQSLGDVQSTLTELETKVLGDLVEEVVVNQGVQLMDAFVRASQYAWQLDALFAFAEIATELHWTRPQYTPDHAVLEIHNGRHPLLQITHPRSIVANDVVFRPQGPRVLLLTGANNSGKSVFIKQCAIIAYLAHIGSFVPADMVTVGPISAILTCTASATHGSFASDLSRVSRMLRFPYPGNAIFVIDEFGKGTLADDGVALLGATLNAFLVRGGESCPNVLLTTHYNEVLSRCLIPQNHPLLDVCCMSVTVTRNTNNSSNTSGEVDVGGDIQYHYRKEEGISRGSHALPFALHCGIPRDVVDRAAVVAQHIQCLLPIPHPQAGSGGESLSSPSSAIKFAELSQILGRFLACDFCREDDYIRREEDEFKKTVLKRQWH